MTQKPQNPFSVEDLEKEIEEEEQSRARGNFAKKTLGILVAIKEERLRLRKEVLESFNVIEKWLYNSDDLHEVTKGLTLMKINEEKSRLGLGQEEK